MRLTVVAGPEDWSQRASQALISRGALVHPLALELAAQWLEDQAMESILAERRAELARRQGLLVRHLAGQPCRSHPAAHHAWLELPAGVRSALFVYLAEQRGVAVTDGAWFRVGRSASPDAVRRCLGGAPTLSDLDLGIDLLRGLLTERPSGSAPAL
jgi:DNA-binding transcriptional MocR family regulator